MDANHLEYMSKTFIREATGTTWEVSVEKPRLKENERGLICFPPLVTQTVSGGDLTVNYNQEVDYQSVRFSLLFWDQLDIPRGFLPNGDLGLGILIDEGLLTRSYIRPPVLNNMITFEDEHEAGVPLVAFTAHEELEPDRWSLQHRSNVSLLPRGQHHGAWFRLESVIPVPDVDVPLQDVLEYKHRRRGELEAFRHYMDELSLDIAVSPEKALSERVVLQRLVKAIEDQKRAISERGLAYRLTGCEIKINLPVLMGVGLTAAAMVGTTSGTQMLLGAAGSLLASAGINFGAGVDRRGGSPVEYLCHFGGELYRGHAA